MSRGRNYGKKQPDIALQMECLEEPLTQEQAAAYNKGEKEYKEVTTRLQDMVKNMGGEIVEKTDSVYVVQMTAASPGGAPIPAMTAATPAPTGGRAAGPSATLIAQPPPATTTMGGSPQPGVMTRAAAGNAVPGTYQLVMDPRLGLIVGAVTSAQPTPGTPVIQNSTSLAKTPPIAPAVQTRSTMQTRTSAMRINASPTVVTPPQKQTTTPVNKIPIAPAPTVPQPTPTVPPLRIKAPKPPPNQKTPPASNATPKPNNTKAPAPSGGGASRPMEGNSVGGLAAGPGSKPWRPPANAADNAPVVDLTDDDKPPPSLADTREITFNKLSGKTFPSLVVVARPNLRVKDMSQQTISQERATLDSKVKSVLMYSATKFTEWLIQQGLVKSEQYCTTHVMPDGSAPVKLKLGMYSDVSKFPYSGGYVWISECCPLRFVSVFSGSVFEGAPHPPTVLLKLMYHWACQTNVQNVVQWVKVDNFYVKNFFTNMRSICTTAIHEKYEKMGGLRKRVEVGVISLGTTSQDGNMRQVKVEVLGVMEPESKLIRLRAVEPLQDGERNYKRRFVKILEPLEQWVDKDSIILTDFTVDKGTLHNMGFSSVYQVSISDNPNPQNKYSNQNVMEYLRRIVPRMFQNTLSLLSRQIIQQFLDELVWRERWGPVASQAFDNIIIHMAEQTKLETGDSLLTRLFKVAANPFKNWTYSSWKSAPTPKTPITNGTTTPPAPPPAPAPEPEPIGPISSIDMLPQSIRTIDPPPVTQNSKRSRKRAATSTPGEGSEAKRTASASPAPTSTSTPPPVPPPEEQVPLDSYYYGSLEGDAQIVSEEYKTSDISAKCCVCHRKYSNNIALMKHLIMHAQSENQFSTELSDLTQCKYCLKSFPTPFSMQTHIEEIHLKTSTSQVCRICEEKFRDRGMLISHMHRTHTCLELPYECGVCKFRSSMHRDLIDHFYEVHYGGEKFQCPFCLKIVAFANHGKKISANVHFFLNHIQKHQRKSIARKCNKCSMWFVHKGILKEHQIKDHISFKDVPGVKPFVNPSGMEVMMPFPPVMNVSRGGPLQHKRAIAAQLKAIQSASYATKKFENQLTICGVEDGTKCCECEGDVLEEDHFVGYLTCLRCRYGTCCSKAMAEHAVVFHETSKPEYTQGRIIQLPSEMFCVCGYKCSSGNKLANHLARCERKSAYPSPSQAKAATIQSASFPPLVTLDDVDNPGEDPSDRWLKAFVPSRKEDPGEGSKDAPDKKNSAQQESKDPPSMLNILGLVRKPSTDDSSLDKAPSDSESQMESKTETGDAQTESNKQEPPELQEAEGKAEPADKEETPETADKQEKMEEKNTPEDKESPPEPEEEKMEVDASEPIAMETDEQVEVKEKPEKSEETKEQSKEGEVVVEENKMEASPAEAEEDNSQSADTEPEPSAKTETSTSQENSTKEEEQENKESTAENEEGEDMNTVDSNIETEEPSSPKVNSNEEMTVPEKSVVQDE